MLAARVDTIGTSDRVASPSAIVSPNGASVSDQPLEPVGGSSDFGEQKATASKRSFCTLFFSPTDERDDSSLSRCRLKGRDVQLSNCVTPPPRELQTQINRKAGAVMLADVTAPTFNK